MYREGGPQAGMGSDCAEQILGDRGSSPLAPCTATVSWAGAALVSPANLVEGCSAPRRPARQAVRTRLSRGRSGQQQSGHLGRLPPSLQGQWASVYTPLASKD